MIRGTAARRGVHPRWRAGGRGRACAVQYLVNGTAMPINGTKDGVDQCSSRCVYGDCDYECTEDTYLQCGA